MPGAACSAQNTQNLHLHRLRPGAREDGPCSRHLAAMNLTQRVEASVRPWRGDLDGALPEERCGNRRKHRKTQQCREKRVCLTAQMHVYKINRLRRRFE